MPRLSGYHEYCLSRSAAKLSLVREKGVGSILKFSFFIREVIHVHIIQNQRIL